MVMNDVVDWDSVGDADADEVAQSVAQTLKPGDGDFRRYAAEVGRWTPGRPTDHLPKEFQDYLARPYDLPTWVDPEAVDRAQLHYQSIAQAGQVVLAAYSLPILYLHRQITASLMGTGQLVLRARGRLADTLTFAEQVMKPGSLQIDGMGWRWIRKVRLTHAILRIVLRDPGHGPRAALNGLTEDAFAHPLAALQASLQVDKPDSVPMSQAQLAFVLQTFAWVMVSGLEVLGLEMDRRKRDDHIRCWALIGHMLGINDKLIPGSSQLGVGTAQFLFEDVRSKLVAFANQEARNQIERPPLSEPLKEVPALEGGRILMSTLLVVIQDVLRSNIPARFRPWVDDIKWLDDALLSLPRLILRDMMGADVCRALRLERPPLVHYLVGRLALTQIDLTNWKPASAERVALSEPMLLSTLETGLF